VVLAANFFLSFALYSVSKLAVLWHIFWAVLVVMLYARYDLINQIPWFIAKSTNSIFRRLESSLAYEILLFSTCGEFFALIKRVQLRQRP